MKVGLFIPCYIDQFYPQVGIAVYQYLKKQQIDVMYPMEQTCCGQPLANSGMISQSEKYAKRFNELFYNCDYVVCPSGSCVLHVKEHFPKRYDVENQLSVSSKTFEYVEFLHDILRPGSIEAEFPYKVALLQSCHGLRGLRLASSSELKIPHFSKNENILKLVRGIKLIPYEKEDECCGFGGTFSVFEEIISVKMGLDKLKIIAESGVEYITANDMSCLMHLEGLSRRENLKLKFIHIAEILNFTR